MVNGTGSKHITLDSCVKQDGAGVLYAMAIIQSSIAGSKRS